MYKYIYKNRITGQKVYSNKKLNLQFLDLVKEFRDGKLKANEIMKK